MIAAGFIDSRYKDEDVASMRRLAEEASTSASTISAMMAGDRETDGAVLDRVAEALGVDPKMVYGWAGRTRSEGRPFKPHRDANLLTAEEQEAVNELIRLLALPKREGGERGGDTPATKGPPLRPVGSDGVVQHAARRSSKRKPSGQGEQPPD